jgi:hypothetical protein
VRKEPLYKEVTEISEVIKSGLTSAVDAVKHCSEEVAKASAVVKSRLVSAVEAGKRRSEPIYEEVTETSAAIKSRLISTVEAVKRRTEPTYEEVAKTSKVIKSGLISSIEAGKRLVRSEPGNEATAETAGGRDDGVTDADRETASEIAVSANNNSAGTGVEATSIERLQLSQDMVAKFQDFCRTAANFNPPAPLAFDALRLFEEFEAVQRKPLTTEESMALAQERSNLERQIAPHQQKLEGVQGRLGTASFRALGSFSSGLKRERTKKGGLLFREELKVRRAAWTKLGQAKITSSPEPIGNATRQKINRAARFLTSRWSDKIDAELQGLFSVYQDQEAQQTIIQVAGGQAGSLFITLPGLLDPMEVARHVLEALRGVLSDALSPSDPVVVLNGAFPDVNMKEMLSGRVVVRSRSEQTEPLSQRIAILYERAPLIPENTTILSAMPTSAEDLARMRLDPGAADLWNDVTPAYARIVADRGFAPALTVQSTAPDFLRALERKENVIVLVAHAQSDRLYFPDGSEVRPSDIEAMRDGIARNKPVVYLLCCETAQYSMVNTISETLLRCGAAAVVAPQETVQPDRSRGLLSHFLAQAARQTPIAGLREAEAATRNYSMETWLG